MSQGIQIDPMKVITALRTRIGDLEYENAVFRATIESMREEAEQPDDKQASAMPKRSTYSKEV